MDNINLMPKTTNFKRIGLFAKTNNPEAQETLANLVKFLTILKI